MTKINSSEISIVIQGPIIGVNKYSSENGVTYDCIKSFKKIFPLAEIILSTWKGSNVENLIYDKLIFCSDPGGCTFSIWDKLNNLNRMILGTQAGLNIVTRKYCLKVRSDILMSSNKFLKYFDKFPKRTDKFQLFDHKVIVCSYYSYRYFRKDNKFMFTPFHISDWIMFGLSNDIKKLFDITTVKEPYFSQYFKSQNYPQNKKDFFKDCYWQLPPEQYIFYNALKKKYPDIELKDKTDYNYTNVKQSEHAVLNNFIIIEPCFWKFVILKDYYYNLSRFPESIPEFIWEGMYRISTYKKYYNKMFNINAFNLPKLYEFKRYTIIFIKKIKNYFVKAQ